MLRDLLETVHRLGHDVSCAGVVDVLLTGAVQHLVHSKGPVCSDHVGGLDGTGCAQEGAVRAFSMDQMRYQKVDY